ncbi:MAG: thioredoxin family protein [Thermoleophilia bacterium]|nr:thioredoxin family protein [Thermoleophilia bacterium]
MAADIQLLWWRGCPSWERALAMLGEEMTAHGLDKERLEVIEIEDEAAADRLGFPGSPTILVNGVDIQPPDPQQAVGLTCRVYRRRDGRVSPLPDPEDLRDAFARMER